MPPIAQRARDLAGRVGRSLVNFAVTSPPASGFVPPGSHAGANRDPKTVRQLRSEDALFGRVTYGAGSQTRYSTYPGVGVEPQQIWNLQIQRNNGYPEKWTEFIEHTLERDGHLGGIYDTRRQSVADKPFRCHPARRGDPVADVLAKVIERAVDKIDAFDQTIEDLLSASAYGYAVSEIVWQQAKINVPLPNGSSATIRIKVPRTIEWHHWKCVRFDRDTDEPYLRIGAGGEYEIPPHKFIFHAAGGTGLIERRGFMGACAWLSAAKRWSERDWLVYAKLFGIPNIMARYPDGQEEYQTHREKYVQFLKDWGEGIPALLPDSLVTEITREPAGRSSDVHGSIIGWANAEMSKRILGSTLTVEMGGQGSWAAADTHRDAPYMRSRTDGRKLCSTLRRDLFKSIIELNRDVLANAIGESPDALADSVPQCSFRIEKEMSPRDRQAIYEGAVNELGLEVDEDQYRDEMGLDAPRPGGGKLKGKPIQIGAGGLAPSVDASNEGAAPPPDDDTTQPQPPALPANTGHDGGATGAEDHRGED